MGKVFLGGTCNGSTWREELIPKLKCDYFNPVVEDWTPECQQRELKERESADACLYTITSEMKGVYSIAEVVDDSNKRSEKTVLCILPQGFDEAQFKSLCAVASMVQRNGGRVFHSLSEVAEYLNGKLKQADDQYCHDCDHLSCSEEEQNQIKAKTGQIVDHKCLKFRKKLFHHGHHPFIVKCNECRHRK